MLLDVAWWFSGLLVFSFVCLLWYVFRDTVVLFDLLVFWFAGFDLLVVIVLIVLVVVVRFSLC